jgi:hypothetical protein
MGTGTPSERFECDIYLPRQKPNREWIIDVCHTLWQHGMIFLTPLMLVGSWEEQLYTTSRVPQYSGNPLNDQINDIMRYGFGEIFGYDHNVRIDLNVDTDLRSVDAFMHFAPEEKAVLERLSLGRLEVCVQYPVIDAKHRLADALPPEQVPDSAYLVPPYQQIHLTMMHWLEILCLKLQPAFAVGYYATDSYFPDESDFRHEFDIAMISALEQNQLPPFHKWFNNIYLLYTPASLLEAPQAEEWFSSPQMWTRHLENGGRIGYAMPETLDEIRAKDFNTEAEKLLRQNKQERLPLARIYLQRAQEIATVTQSTNYTTLRLLEQVEYMEQNPEIFFK